MPETLSIWTRPALGFVVEGAGEFECYPSLAARLTNDQGWGVCVNAGGFGSIISALDEHLTDLVIVHHPVAVIITVDLGDVLNNLDLDDCHAVKEHINCLVDQWKIDHAVDERCLPMPESISVVLQCPKIEAWLITNPEALAAESLINLEDDFKPWQDVDVEIRNPANWLESRLNGSKLKRPSFQKKCVSATNLSIAEGRSRSFRKFAKEIRNGFEIWRSIAMP